MNRLTLSQIKKLVEVFSVAEANEYLEAGWKIFDKRLAVNAPNGAATSYVLAWYEVESDEPTSSAAQSNDVSR